MLPHFDYGDIVYQHCSQDLLLRLQYVQNNACRMILMAGKYTNVAAMHADLGLSTLVERRLFHSCGFMYKVQNDQIKAERLLILFDEIGGAHGRDTRASQRGDLVVLQTRTGYGERAIQVFGSRIWNMVPIELRQCNTFESFCRNYWKTRGK